MSFNRRGCVTIGILGLRDEYHHGVACSTGSSDLTQVLMQAARMQKKGSWGPQGFPTLQQVTLTVQLQPGSDSPSCRQTEA